MAAQVLVEITKDFLTDVFRQAPGEERFSNSRRPRARPRHDSSSSGSSPSHMLSIAPR